MTERRIPLAVPSFGPEEERRLVETLRSGWVAQGPRVEELECRFAEIVGAREAVAVSSGTAALFLSLHALGIGPGDEVVVPSLSFIASANAIVHCGATPIFAEVQAGSYNVTADTLEQAIGPRTRAVMVVHQLGMPADLETIAAMAARRGGAVVEDAACALGARLRGRPIGSFGHPACFSLHPRKVVVAGEGGLVTTDDPTLAARLRRLRHQGMSVSDVERHRAEHVIVEQYEEIGYNFRLSDLHAAVAIAQLERLDGFVERRRAVARRYEKRLADVAGLELPNEPAWARTNFQSYIVRLRDAPRARRDAVMDAMLRRGIATRRGLMASHREPCYAGCERRVPLADTERFTDETLCIPMYADLTPDDQDRVVAALRTVVAEESDR